MSRTRKINNSIVLSLILAYVLVYFTLVIQFIPEYSTLINALFTIFILGISYFLYGFQKCSINKLRRDIIIEVFIGIFIYFTVIYLIGLFTGYLKNVYSLNIFSIIKNIAVPLIITIGLELTRYIIVSSNRDAKNIIVLYTLAIMLLDIAFNFYMVDLTLVAIFVFFTTIVLPLILKNIVLSYLSYQVGYQACLVYTIPICIYTFVVPVFSYLGNYLTCMLGVTLPSLIFIYSSRMISSSLSESTKKVHVLRILFLDIPLIVFFIILTILISGYFNYHLIGVDTSKIEPQIKRGDAVIIYKKLETIDYRRNDIVAYLEGDKIIIDSLSKVEDEDEVVKLYVTSEIKDKKDKIYKEIKEEQLLGRYTSFRVPKIAYPTIWFKEFIKGDVNEVK